MSRRHVIGCDECGKDADMAYPERHRATSASMFGSGFQGVDVYTSLKPHPPEGWLERFDSMRMSVDLCSVECVAAWGEKQPNRNHAPG